MSYFDDDLEANMLEDYMNSNKDVKTTETIDVRKIVINCLKVYDLKDVEDMNLHGDLADEIINDLVNAGFMK